jgi:ribosomal protein S18 acetylase RimI-like enzyme
MDAYLDNPIYHALRETQQEFAAGAGDILFYQPEIAPFAGLKTHSTAELDQLYDFFDPGSSCVIFTGEHRPQPSRWTHTDTVPMYQMVFEGELPDFVPADGLTALSENHVPEMTALVELTRPGPFRPQTIRFGNYLGVFRDGSLAAMAGHRIRPPGFVEISAVCTHPAFTGRGYGYLLVREHAGRILGMNQVPFLHVRSDNEGAIRVYHKAGFRIRRELWAHILAR